MREQIKAMLPFKPTGAQKRVLGEIADDMNEPRPMNRLLQGDVGSGKTIVAAEAAVIAIENGYQVAVLAPTEILATQHGLYFKQILSQAGLRDGAAHRLVHRAREGAAQEAGRRRPGARGRSAPTRCSKRTSSSSKLGLAIIDEQHRFGVLQRLGLVQKGVHPDVLVMTATPIPRTLAMTLYGDLDVSVIDELPPGRKPIITKHYTADQHRAGLQLPEAPDRRGAPGVRGLSGDRGVGNAGHEGRAEDVRAPLARGLPRCSPWACCTAGWAPAEKEAAMQRFKDGRDARFWSRPP